VESSFALRGMKFNAVNALRRWLSIGSVATISAGPSKGKTAKPPLKDFGSSFLCQTASSWARGCGSEINPLRIRWLKMGSISKR